ncbi:MAG: hypothetical protein A3H69_05960 [Candidatus Sungbacteria bacterium RIFCSPLOWO2_02_FULL_47_9]|nr:MAG: hypothetical protein A3H69_05960 [Candidatus Sungbacteria bacterium RIFCSPLOWO2_02_FULL_47_9]
MRVSDAVFGLLLFGLGVAAYAVPVGDEKYPEKIKGKITEADTRIVCERNSPRKVGTILYMDSKKNWLVRVFTKDGVEMEAWYNSDMNAWFAAYNPSKIYYRRESGVWVDAEGLSESERDALDHRIKFTSGELSFFSDCFKKKSGK